MADLDADILIVGVILLGGALQLVLGGPWLLMAGTVAMGPRIAFARDDRRAGVFTVGGGVVWIALHWVLGRELTRVQVAAEVLTFLAVLAAFWVVRLAVRESGVAADDEEAGVVSADEMEQRLERLKGEAGAIVQEREGWVGLFGIMKSMGEVIRVENVVEAVKAAAREHLRMPSFALLLVENGMVRVRAQQGGDETVMGAAEFPAGIGSLAGWLVAQRDPMLVDDLREDPRFQGAVLPYRAMVALPLRMGEEAVGALLAFDRESRAFTRTDYQRAGILSKQLGLGVGKTLLYAQVEELSITDGLTGLYRHRYFQERFEGELERARRYGRPLALVMADLDNFKAYNDRYGHLEGDELLRTTGRSMREQFRRQAILARYGGEEFAILLPDVSRAQAAEEAERFRAALAAHRPGAAAEREPVTLSLGVAVFPDDAQTRRDLVARADEALYRAKHGGKNRIAVHEAAS